MNAQAADWQRPVTGPRRQTTGATGRPSTASPVLQGRPRRDPAPARIPVDGGGRGPDSHDELASFNLMFTALAFRELGEVSLKMGDIDTAEEAFRQAQEMGRRTARTYPGAVPARHDPGAAASSGGPWPTGASVRPAGEAAAHSARGGPDARRPPDSAYGHDGARRGRLQQRTPALRAAPAPAAPRSSSPRATSTVPSPPQRRLAGSTARSISPTKRPAPPFCWARSIWREGTTNRPPANSASPATSATFELSKPSPTQPASASCSPLASTRGFPGIVMHC